MRASDKWEAIISFICFGREEILLTKITSSKTYGLSWRSTKSFEVANTLLLE